MGVPNKFHQTQYYMAGIVACLALILYMYAPPAKSEMIAGVLTLATGYMFGKFSNGFKGGYEKEEEDNKDATGSTVSKSSVSYSRRTIQHSGNEQGGDSDDTP